MTEEELKHRRGRRPKSGVVTVKERVQGTYRCRRIVRRTDDGKDTIQFVTNVLDPEEMSAEQVCEMYRRRWSIESLFYDKFIVMQSKVRSIPDNQMFVRLLLTSTSHNNSQCPRSLSQSRRSLLFSHSLSESRLGRRSAYAFSSASRLALESALA